MERVVEQADGVEVGPEAGDERDRARRLRLEHHLASVPLGDRLEQGKPTAHVGAAPECVLVDGELARAAVTQLLG